METQTSKELPMTSADYAQLKAMTDNQILECLNVRSGLTSASASTLTTDDFDLLRNGRYNKTLLHSNYKDNVPENIKDKVDAQFIKVRLVPVVDKLGERIEGFCPKPLHKHHELEIPESFMNYKFTAKDLDDLKQYKTLSNVVDITTNNGKTLRGFISVDTDLNMLRFLDQNTVYVGNKFGNNELTARQVQQLKDGYPVLYPNFEKKDGTRSNVKISLDRINGKIRFGKPNKLTNDQVEKTDATRKNKQVEEKKVSKGQKQ